MQSKINHIEAAGFTYDNKAGVVRDKEGKCVDYKGNLTVINTTAPTQEPSTEAGNQKPGVMSTLLSKFGLNKTPKPALAVAKGVVASNDDPSVASVTKQHAVGG